MPKSFVIDLLHLFGLKSVSIFILVNNSKGVVVLKLAVWNPKGGVGKSTIALNLAGAIAARGRRVAVVDLDPQGSIIEAAGEGNLPFRVFAELDANEEVDVVVFDYPPSFDVYPDFQEFKAVFFPMRPSRPDVKAGLRVFKDLQRSFRAIPILSCADFRKKVQKSIFNVLRKSEMFSNVKFVRQRVAFEIAWNDARTVFDSKMERVSGVQEARIEIAQLLKG